MKPQVSTDDFDEFRTAQEGQRSRISPNVYRIGMLPEIFFAILLTIRRHVQF